MFGKVLVPTDFSEYSKKTIVCLTVIPGITEVVLQHVVDATRHTRHGWTHQAHIENARIQLEEEKKFLEHLGFVVRGNVDAITSGDIPAAILTKAGCENVLSIIIGSRGRGLVKGLLPGSVSADILRHGKTHLLIFRHSLADAEDISLILMSSHGKGLLTELLVGSTILGVAIHTNRPLMVIRTPGKPRK